MRPLSLYDIDADLLELEDALIAAGGEVTPELEAAHDLLLDLRAEKVEGCVRVIRRLEATAAAIRAERQRLQEAERGMARAAQALKDRLAASMQQRGDREYLTSLGKVKLQQGGAGAVELLVDVEALPDAFVRVSRSADLTAIREALRAEDPGLRAEAERLARLAEPTPYVRIY